MRKHIFLFFLLHFISLSAFSQREDLSSSMPFFERKAGEYQHWLDAKGFGDVLKVERVRLKVDRRQKVDSTELELFLLLQATDADTAIAKWNRLKKDVDTDADSLEALLFRTFIHKMEIPEAQGNIQIYVRNKYASYIKGYYLWIWQENGRIAIDNKLISKGGEPFEISVAYPVKQTGKGKSSKLPSSKRRSANDVFDIVLKLVNNTMLEHPRYRKELNDRMPHIENDSVRTATTLKFTVADLGKEVLTDQNRYFWEPWVGINTIAMERLNFQFEYYPTADGGYSLKCTIEGKFGSGVFKPRVTGYMNMEPDFDDFLEKYKNDFRLKLLSLLQKKP